MLGYMGFENVDEAITSARTSIYAESVICKEKENNYYVIDDTMHGEVWIPLFEEASLCGKYWHVGDGVELPLNNNGSFSGDMFLRYCGSSYNKFTFKHWLDPIQKCQKMGMARLETIGEFAEIPLNVIALNAYSVLHDVAEDTAIDCQITALPLTMNFFSSAEECREHNRGMAVESFIPNGTFSIEHEEYESEDIIHEEWDEDEVIFEEWDEEDDLEKELDDMEKELSRFEKEMHGDDEDDEDEVAFEEWDEEDDFEKELDDMEEDLSRFEKEMYGDKEDDDADRMTEQKPQAIISGKVKLAEMHINRYTNRPYLHVVMESLGVTYDVIVTAEGFDMPLENIKYISGTFVLAAHIKNEAEERHGENYHFEIDGTCTEAEFEERFAPYIEDMRTMKSEFFILELGKNRNDEIVFMQTTKYNDIGEPEQYRVEYGTEDKEGKRKLYALDSDEVRSDMALAVMKAIATGKSIPYEWRDITFDVFGKEYYTN